MADHLSSRLRAMSSCDKCKLLIVMSVPVLFCLRPCERRSVDGTCSLTSHTAGRPAVAQSPRSDAAYLGHLPADFAPDTGFDNCGPVATAIIVRREPHRLLHGGVSLFAPKYWQNPFPESLLRVCVLVYLVIRSFSDFLRYFCRLELLFRC